MSDLRCGTNSDTGIYLQSEISYCTGLDYAPDLTSHFKICEKGSGHIRPFASTRLRLAFSMMQSVSQQCTLKCNEALSFTSNNQYWFVLQDYNRDERVNIVQAHFYLSIDDQPRKGIIFKKFRRLSDWK